MSERSIFITALGKGRCRPSAAIPTRHSPAMRSCERIERLLKTHEPAGSSSSGPSVLDATDNFEPIDERPGQVIGP